MIFHCGKCDFAIEEKDVLEEVYHIYPCRICNMNFDNEITLKENKEHNPNRSMSVRNLTLNKNQDWAEVVASSSSEKYISKDKMFDQQIKNINRYKVRGHQIKLTALIIVD